MGLLYKLTFPSGKSYVGITTKTLNKRLDAHKRLARLGSQMAISCALRKYGDDFNKEVLVIANDWDYLCELEIKAIDVYDTFAPNGYNLTKGGDGAFGRPASEKNKLAVANANRLRVVSDETKEKHRIRMLGNTYTLGYTPSEETIKKLSDLGKGRVASEQARLNMSAAQKVNMARPDVRKKISDAKKGKRLSVEHRMSISKTRKEKRIPAPNKGIPHTDEAKEKMSQARKQYWINKKLEKKQ